MEMNTKTESQLNLLEIFRRRLEEALKLVLRMNADDTFEAVQYWNVYSEKMQDMVNHSAEVAEIEAIEAMALDLEQTNSIILNSDLSEEVVSDIVSLPADSKSDISEASQHNGNINRTFQNNTCSNADMKTGFAFIVNNNEEENLNDKEDDNGCVYRCQMNGCNAEFGTKGNLVRHIRIHDGRKPWKCSECSSNFTEKKSLKIHMRKHTGERPYICSICNKSFAQSGVLNSHLAIHTDSKSFTCNQCGRKFRQKSHLTLHLQRHAGIRRFSCSECEFKFLTKGDLERHQKIHSGERPFTCEMCNKSFARPQSLKDHFNRHFGDKPYSCKYCRKAFSEMSGCYKHMKTHNEIIRDDEKTDITRVTGNNISNETSDFKPSILNNSNEPVTKFSERKKKFR